MSSIWENDVFDDHHSADFVPTKMPRYRRFDITPILNFSISNSNIELTEASVLKIPDKRLITKLLAVLPPIVAELNHLKRVNGALLLVTVGREVEQAICSQISGVIESKPEFKTQMVPRYKPKTMSQFESCKQHWPVSFHKDAKLESTINGAIFDPNEKTILCDLFMGIEKTGGILFYDPVTNKVVAGGGMEERKPLAHPVMVAIESLSKMQRSSEQSQYLATGYYAILSEEPCTMCAMALVHSRVKRVFFGKANSRFGAICSRWRLQESPSINHHFEVFMIKEIF